jgi:hypothetical protein
MNKCRFNSIIRRSLVLLKGEGGQASTHQSQGDPLKFWYIHWAAYWKAGGVENKKHRPKDYLKWVEWETKPLPHLKGLNIHQRQTRIRKLVKKEEEEQEAIRQSEKRTVIGVPALFETDPRDRPKNPKPRTRQPLCHAGDKDVRRAYALSFKEVQKAHRKASIEFRNGDRDYPFPAGTFRPPLVRIIHGDGT